jgi:hypothetical protein
MNYPTVLYECSLKGVDEFKKEIKEKLKEIEINPERADNPVADFLSDRNITLISSDKKANLAKLGALVSELSYNIGKVDTTLNIVKKSEQDRDKDKKALWISTARFDNACLELILSTSYIKLDQKLLRSIKGLNNIVESLNNILERWGQKEFTRTVETRLKESLPAFREISSDILEIIGKIWVDYQNDNYIEPETTAIVLSTADHQKYVQLRK